ncbi:transposase [Roseovarius sp. M141]|uniref:transposase n=1 Tax=Roseovarius sp. M141 TaxID=2583806 RepID=UPI0020CC12A5|nr:transposase [Roseovarius sp. M141]
MACGDQKGQFIDFRPSIRRDAKAARALLKKAIERVRLYRPVAICTDMAPSYRKVIQDLNHGYDPHFYSITHIDRKWRNNRIKSDHAALTRVLGARQSLDSLRSAKATLMAIETIRTIKNGHIQIDLPDVEARSVLPGNSSLRQPDGSLKKPTSTRPQQRNGPIYACDFRNMRCGAPSTCLRTSGSGFARPSEVGANARRRLAKVVV